MLHKMLDQRLRRVLPKHAQPGLSVQEVVHEDVRRDKSMLTVQSTCGLDRRREHGVKTDDGRINSFNELCNLAKVCKVHFLFPGCNEDLYVFRKCLDTFSARRSDGSDSPVLVGYKVLVKIESLVERSAIELMEDNILRPRLVLLSECRDFGNCFCQPWERRKMYLNIRGVLEQTLSGSCVDVGVTWVFADNVKNCIVSSSDIIARRRCWL